MTPFAANRGAGISTRVFLPFIGLLLAVGIWWLFTTPLWHQNSLIADFSPERTAIALTQLLQSGVIIPHLLTSLRRVLVGLGVATILGIPLGVLLGLYHPAEQATSVLFQFLRMISPLSWMPIAIMALGIGDLPVYFLLAIAAIWPLILNTTAGVHAVEPRWLLLARSLCANRWETIWQVVLPAILAHVLTGLRLAVGIIWIVLVPAEMLGVSAGLGYYILDTRDRLAYSELMAVILIIGAIGYLLDSGLRWLHRHWHH